MDDIISRQAAIDELYSINPTESDYIFIDEAVQRLENLPPVQERKKGKWIEGQCSVCGCDVPAYIIGWQWQQDMDANYCPHCGADMRGAEDG